MIAFGSIFRKLSPARQLAAIIDGGLSRIASNWKIQLKPVEGAVDVVIVPRGQIEACLCEGTKRKVKK